MFAYSRALLLALGLVVGVLVGPGLPHGVHHHHHHHGHDSHPADHGAQQINQHHSHHHHGSAHHHRKVMVSRHPDLGQGAAAIDYAVWTQALLSTAMVGLAPILILYFIPSNIGHRNDKSQNLLKVLLAFAVGGLLGDVFLHLLPHAMESHASGHTHQHGFSGFWVLTGILLFLTIEKFILTFSPNSHGHSHGRSHGHSHGKRSESPPKAISKAEAPTDNRNSSESEQDGLRKRRKDAHNHENQPKVAESQLSGSSSSRSSNNAEKSIAPAAYLNLAADFTHNFTDGLAIGSSFLHDSKVGFVTVLAILLHEIPHEIGDFAILIQAGFSWKSAMRMQIWTAFGALLGTSIGLMTEGASPESSWILPMTAGGFLYIAMSSAIPEILKPATPTQSIKEIVAIGIGIGLMATISLLE